MNPHFNPHISPTFRCNHGTACAVVGILSSVFVPLTDYAETLQPSHRISKKLSAYRDRSRTMSFSCQPLDHAQGLRLSASEKRKSSSILLAQRRNKEKEGFACSERSRGTCMPQHLTRKVPDNNLDMIHIFVLSRLNLVRNAG